MLVLCGGACLAMLAACAPNEAPGDTAGEPALASETAQIAEGRAIAERECGSCHALDASADAPRSDTPPLAEVLLRYDQHALANDLIEGIQLGHDDMPLFDFNVIAADALVAYLRSIRPAPDPEVE